jgi:hypothetical protein
MRAVRSCIRERLLFSIIIPRSNDNKQRPRKQPCIHCIGWVTNSPPPIVDSYNIRNLHLKSHVIAVLWRGVHHDVVFAFLRIKHFKLIRFSLQRISSVSSSIRWIRSYHCHFTYLTKIVIAVVNLDESFSERASMKASIWMGWVLCAFWWTIKADALCVGLTNWIDGPAASLGWNWPFGVPLVSYVNMCWQMGCLSESQHTKL